MKKIYLFIPLCMMVCSCTSNTNNNNKSDEEASVLNESSDKPEEVFSDAENCFKQWNADNPKRPDIDYLNETHEPGVEVKKALQIYDRTGQENEVLKEWSEQNKRLYKEYVKQNYGKKHSRTAIVRMYDKYPLLPDGSTVSDKDVSSMNIQTGDFIVYSVWRGPVVAKNIKTNYWFVVWDEDYHYNTKYIRAEGDGLVTMEYIDASDIDDNTDVIHYNLNTHKYYFAKEKYTGVIWPD